MIDDKWQESWDRMEESERRNRDIGELPCAHCGGDGACATNGADRGGVNCDDPQLVCPHCKGAQRGPDAPEPCEACHGEGSFWKKEEGGSLSGSRTLCRRCLGSKEKP